MTIDVRPIHDDELVPWLDAMSIGFLDRLNVEKLADEVREHWDLERVWGAVEGDRVVGTTRTWPTELTVPGNARIKASAITAVTVRPTHRRRGLLRRMLAAEHAAARERGEIASLLYASEYPIYTRFGYGVACQTATWSVDVSRTGFHEAAGGRTGAVELIPADDAAVDTIRGVFDAWRIVQPGEIWRRPIMYRSDLGLAGQAWGETWKGFVAVHRAEDGSVDGFTRYRGEAKWEHRQPSSVLNVEDLVGLSSDATVALLRFLADVDLVRTLKIEHRTPTDRLRWLLTDARAAEPLEVGDGMWLKVHDVAGALAARSYQSSGSLVLEVVTRDDGEDGSKEGRVRVALDVSPDGARADPTDASPDLTIDAAALGAAYLGGSRLRDAAIAGGWDEHRPGALALADRLLACADAPWCSTFF
jgi:predicted acetyltransferase